MFNLLAALTLAASVAAADAPTLEGRATYYGSYFNGRPLGCGGTYWATDATIAAVPMSRNREWPCGTQLRVTGPNGEITVTRRDSCPGCDAHNVAIDLSEAASAAVCGRPMTCWVLIEPLLPATLSTD